MRESNFQEFIYIVLIGILIPIVAETKPIKGIFIDFALTEKVKASITDKQYQPAYSRLIGQAEVALIEGTFSVMYKKHIPPSGDKHDYLSIGPYWWPDSTKTDGLPYIRSDGKISPEFNSNNFDSSSKNKLISNVETLTWAYYFSNEKKYAEKAIELLEVWFINPETRMNPNLNYVQGIPGICEGRGIGIIDWGGIYKIIPSIRILNANGFFSTYTKNQLFSWFNEYLNWLQHSKNGKDIDNNAENNHGTWYDVQVAGIALMLGEKKIAKERLEKVKLNRIATQIEPDGSQPLELGRTNSLSYSTMNLNGFILLAILGEQANVDLWNFKTDDGRSILKALDYLAPYILKEKDWTYPQISGTENVLGNIKILFRIAYCKTNIPLFKTVVESSETNTEDIRCLLYPVMIEKNETSMKK